MIKFIFSLSNLFSNLQFWKVDAISSVDVFDKEAFAWAGDKLTSFFFFFLVVTMLDFQIRYR